MQQQHLMQQMQPMMAAYYPTNVTTDHIQQYLDENKSLIMKIVESQNSGKLSECAESQARLQRNLMYLAAIADSQPQPSSIHSQFSSGGMMQPGTQSYLQQQQQMAATQSLMAARSSSLLYGQQQQQQQTQLSPFQQQALHSNQLGMSSGSSTALHHMLQSDASPHHHGGGGGGGSGGGFPHDFGRANKQDIGGNSTMSAEGRGGGSSSGENLYLKASED